MPIESVHNIQEIELTMVRTILLAVATMTAISYVMGDMKPYKYGNMKMYLARAGKLKWALKSETRLARNARISICPTDFKRGFSIRCMPTTPFSHSQLVNFYVNNKLHRNEAIVPYYLNGNNDEKVRPYYFGNRSYLKIKCSSKNTKSATVVIRKKC